MSDTPRTDAAKFWSDIQGGLTLASKCQEIERELNAANEHIKRLEEAGDVLTNDNYSMKNLRDWENAKKYKP